jgi:hypothetical protein
MDEITQNVMPMLKMTVDEMSVDEMSYVKMTCYILHI